MGTLKRLFNRGGILAESNSVDLALAGIAIALVVYAAVRALTG